MAMKVDSKHDVRLTVRKAGDLETHVRTIEIDGSRYVELRDYIPSLEEYGRGYWFPFDKGFLVSLSKVIAEISKEA